MNFLRSLFRRLKRKAEGADGDDRALLPVSEATLLAEFRERIPFFNRPDGARPIDPNVPLVLGSCHARRDPAEGHVTGFTLQILVDPRLGVP